MGYPDRQYQFQIKIKGKLFEEGTLWEENPSEARKYILRQLSPLGRKHAKIKLRRLQ